ncbi:hypothetical protein AN643_04580 [Candidatus Epulonipiscioides saccharophilum]|nr:hypothetical protein AN643_04580 [Epulopiscium sp. SCG-B10WGA-EpuloB]
MLKKSNPNFLKQILIFTSITFAIFFVAHLTHPVVGLLLRKLGLIKHRPVWSYPLITFAAFSLIIGFFISLFVTFSIIRPIKELINGINKVAIGDFQTKIEIFSRISYIQKTISSFNIMLDELNSNEVLKVDFINNFSHEFKTPINSIQGFAKHLKDSNISEKNQQEYIDIIIYESQRLSTLANNVLNLSKIENTVILNNKSKFNLSEQIREVVIMLYEKCSAKNVDINFDAPELYIVAQKELLKQVWINLLDNALKFCYENTEINITVQDKNTKIYVSISNYADPLSEADRLHIFDRFYQINNAQATTGNGLGLTIVKKIIDLHHGNIYLSNVNKITFEIILPLT